MAIEALQQTDRDTISRQAAIDALDGIIVVGGRNNAVRMMRYIEAVRDRLKQLPSAQPVDKDIHVPCNDTISRAAAIDAIEEMQMPIMRSMFSEEQFVFKGMSEALQAIKDLPSAQPDLSSYSDKLWRNAYERGKAEAQAEIVRCKDCKYHLHPWYCEAWNNSPGFPAVSDDMFCSMAERRTDG